MESLGQGYSPWTGILDGRGEEAAYFDQTPRPRGIPFPKEKRQKKRPVNGG